MSTPVKLGAPDPADEGAPHAMCGARSDLVLGLAAPFICTRARGHVTHGLAEHVASGPLLSRLPIAIASWTDGSAPRVVEVDR